MDLNSSNIEVVSELFDIIVDGKPIQALANETIAAALARHNIVITHKESSQRNKGLWCGMGTCFECSVNVIGKGQSRSCVTLVEPGMEIRTDLSIAQPSSLAIPVKNLSVEDEMPHEPALKECDVLVVGAGPGGLSAARVAAMAGAKVLLLDEREQTGGHYFKPLAPSHRVTGQSTSQWQQRDKLVEELNNLNVDIIQSAVVWGAFSLDEIAAIIDGKETIVRTKQLILSPGAYERPVPFPGWTLPGVMTTGAGQTLAKAYRVTPGDNAIISGNGPLNLLFASELIKGGIPVAEILESAAKPSFSQFKSVLQMMKNGLNFVLQGQSFMSLMRKHKVPVSWGQTIIAAHGTDKLERVTIASVAQDGTIIPGTKRDVECNLLFLGHGFIASTDLARMLGCKQSLSNGAMPTPVIETDENGATSVDGVFAVGDGAKMGGSQVALARGALAGAAASQALGLSVDKSIAVKANADLKKATSFQNALWTIYQAPPISIAESDNNTIICRCENVTLGTIKEAIKRGIDTPAALKRNFRIGMGACQGRTCSGMVAKIVQEMTGRNTDVDGFFAPRLPTRPIPISLLTYEKPEWGGHKAAITPNLARPVETSSLDRQKTDVLVIGGGVMGNCLGYYLAKGGCDVLVAERDDINLQASGANAGSLHVQLLSFDFGNKAQHGGGPAAQTLPLGPISVKLWQEIEAASGESLEVKITGGLMVAETADEMRFLEKKIELERQYGIEAELLDQRQLRTLSPHLSDKLLGAEFCPLEGKINPLKATYVVNRLAKEHGARFQRGTDVHSIERLSDGRFVVKTSRGVIEANQVVNAAGAWAGEVAAMLNVNVPVQGAPLQMIVTEKSEPLVDHLIAHAGRHLSLKQTSNGGLLVGGGWSAGFNHSMRMNHSLRNSIEGNLWVASKVLPPIKNLHMLRSWAGMNINIDGAPIISDTKTVPGFWHAVTSNGYTLAPVVAKELTQQILKGSSDLDLSPYHLNRFN
ncbi:FAD-dependent oxidoreductase [Vibrio sp.]|nr:FAD-dependent oxidoreductase [Vibrio sp.]